MLNLRKIIGIAVVVVALAAFAAVTYSYFSSMGGKEENTFVKIASFSTHTGHEDQGVATNGINIWTTFRGYLEEGEPPYVENVYYSGIVKYDMSMNYVDENLKEIAWYSFNGLAVFENYLYVAYYGSQDWPSYIVRYGKDNFIYDNSFGTKTFSYGCAEHLARHDYYGTERWWVLFDMCSAENYDLLEVWDDNFSTNYENFHLFRCYGGHVAGGQGLVWWDNEHILITQHATGIGYPIGCFRWNSSSFTFERTYEIGRSEDCTQGAAKWGDNLLLNTGDGSKIIFAKSKKSQCF